MTAVSAPNEASAQGWSLDAYGGRANYTMLPASVSSHSAVVGIGFNRDYRSFHASLGVPLSSKDVSWSVVEGGDRFALRRGGFVVGADIAAQANADRDPVADAAGVGLLTEALPVISQSVRTLSFELRSGPRWYGARLGDANWTRTLWTTDFRTRVRAGETALVESEIRHDRSRQGEAYTRVGFWASAALRRVALRAGVGDWVDGASNKKPEWDASISIPIRSGVSLFTSAQHESFNPQFLSPPRTSWGMGLTFRIGGGPTPESARAFATAKGGRVVIRLPQRELSGLPSIAGDFTSWTPIAMERRGSEWTFSAELSPGVYRFAFRTADGRWFVPESIPNRTDDGMGGAVAVLVVP